MMIDNGNEVEDEGNEPALSVGNDETRQSRLLSRECATCIFLPGNLMHLAPGGLKEIVDRSLEKQSYVVCHSTLPGNAPQGVEPAICRGFYNRYKTESLYLIGVLFGFEEVEPPQTQQ